jgi:2-polyprenyl-3-methyl-5-hydroxy-6-metoxy-1,4-benzoquinol methylase
MLPTAELDRVDFGIPENVWAHGKRFRFIADAIERHRGMSSTTRFLDIGGGNGSQVAIPLAQLGLEITGIDTDERSIKQAQQYSRSWPNAQFRAG